MFVANFLRQRLYSVMSFLDHQNQLSWTDYSLANSFSLVEAEVNVNLACFKNCDMYVIFFLLLLLIRCNLHAGLW